MYLYLFKVLVKNSSAVSSILSSEHIRNVELSIGGKKRCFVNCHYPAQNLSAPDNSDTSYKKKRYIFLDKDDFLNRDILYR